ncbi:hypothetical protein NFI96_004304 [Prochilodus magdalenae]|nr:hypothetical protein NFI96_004304 [Prochilodus magdalenae]
MAQMRSDPVARVATVEKALGFDSYVPVVILVSQLCEEQVSARIVQEVTAEAVAVLKGEQELHPDTAVRLPSGKAYENGSAVQCMNIAAEVGSVPFLATNLIDYKSVMKFFGSSLKE